MIPAHPIVELRQYTLHPGARDTLVRVFEEHFVEGQEHCGMQIIGQFRDLADPDRFVWIRAFPDADARARALEAFYSGPVWKEHGPAANATMIDHTNVLLLRAPGPELGFRFDPRRRPPPDAAETPGGIIVVTISHLAVPATPAIAASLSARGAPETLLARLLTEPDRKPFARLPVRADANVVVTVATCATAEAIPPSAGADAISAAPSGHPIVSREERLLLEPTRRSFLRHRDDQHVIRQEK